MDVKFGAQVYLYEGKGGMKAFAKLVVNDILVIEGFAVRENSKGLWVSFPSKKSNKVREDGSAMWFDTVTFLEDRKENGHRGPVAEAAYQAILDAYTAKVGTSTGGNTYSGGGGGTRPLPTNSRPAQMDPW